MMEVTRRGGCEEKGAVTLQETDPDLPMTVQESPAEAWVIHHDLLTVHQVWPGAGSGALSGAVHAWDILKEVTIIFITSTIAWPQVKQQGGNTALPINRKLD